MNIFEIISLRRSGHHAFINWLFTNFNGASYKTQNAIYAHDDKLKLLYINEAEFGFNEHQSHITNNLSRIEYLFSSTETAHAKFSILNKFNPVFTTWQNTDFKDKWGVTDYKRVLFIRDFFNCFASQIKASPIHWGTESPYNSGMYNNWKSHASASLEGGYTVFYDKLISDPEYANQVSLDLLNTSNKFNPLDIKGTISSFNKFEKVDLERYLTRYKEVEFPIWFREKVKNDKELQLLLNKLNMKYLF